MLTERRNDIRTDTLKSLYPLNVSFVGGWGIRMGIPETLSSFKILRIFIYYLHVLLYTYYI